MNSEKILTPYDNPGHPLYHFFKKLPPITSAIRGGHSTFALPLYSTSDKILTTLEGISQDVKVLQKDLAGTWTALESLREQQKALPTSSEVEDSMRDSIIPSLQEMGDRCKETLEMVGSKIIDQIDCTLRRELKRACEELQLKATSTANILPQQHHRYTEYPTTPEPRPNAPMTTPDFLQITSPHQTGDRSSQLPPGQGYRFSTRRTFPADDETDVEENITRHTTSSPPRGLFRKPSRRVADLRLPIEETQTIRPTRRPTIGLSRKQSTARLHARKRQKRFLDPGSGEE